MKIINTITPLIGAFVKNEIKKVHKIVKNGERKNKKWSLVTGPRS